MPQPVKLSDTLVNAARAAAPLAHRSLAAQVEHWAALGRAIEASLTLDQSTLLKRAIQEPAASAYAPPPAPEAIYRTVADALDRSLTADFRDTVRAEMVSSPRPTFGTHEFYPGYLVRRDPDGTLTPGRMENRTFVPITPTGRKLRQSAPPEGHRPARKRTA
jgi:hypothetical protein